MALILFREVVGSVLMPVFMATSVGFGVVGIWWGHPLGYALTSIVSYFIARKTIVDLIDSNKKSR